MRVNKLCVEGYRSLVDITLSLHPLNVMIGPNGSGKTSVLDIFQLLRDATQEKLSESLEKQGGLNAVLSKTPDGPDHLKVDLTIDAESERGQAPMYYRFQLTPRDVGYLIQLEELEWHYDPRAPQPFRYIDAHADDVRYFDLDLQKGFVRPSWDYDHTELALAQIPRMYAGPEALRNMLSRTRFFSFLDVTPRSVVRLPQPLAPTTSPGANGENLYSALYNLRATHNGVYERIEEVLRLGFPEFRGLEFPVVGAGQVALAWHQDDLTRPLYASELSEGTLRFLWLVTVLLSPQVSPITLIDEPEVSLHPELLKLLAELLQDASARGQLIVATHSADLVRWLQPDEVLVLDKVDGRTHCTWAHSLDLSHWLREYTLGELWLMGTLGGRP
ncbi:MAG TPA: AAA family ATPase [Anaerolineae bacterium]|nr:AAA family ATPase [Anaerolineae bacterium]